MTHTPSEQVETKLCPFCGGDDCTKHSSEDGFPLIPNCLFESTSYAEVVEKYNVRPLEDALQMKLDVLEGALVEIANEENADPAWVANEALEGLEASDE